MQFKKFAKTATLFLFGSVAAITSANAASSPATSSFDVNMEVESICTISAAPLAVTLNNTEAGQATAAVTQSTDLTVNCSKGDSATISLIPSSTNSVNGTGNLGNSELAGELIAYKLTSGSAEGAAWGGTGNTLTTAAATDYKTGITSTIYLTVTDDADVIPGVYSDTINVSVAY
ncbi:spore coat protein U domain-containing protein [Psychrobacter sp. 1U1]|uniref:spore coat protein U domain-containing protein n=1 Tax=Psychrobacter sp. 1U1 TaxID=3453576 RepID=UPI003F46B517